MSIRIMALAAVLVFAMSSVALPEDFLGDLVEQKLVTKKAAQQEGDWQRFVIEAVEYLCSRLIKDKDVNLSPLLFLASNLAEINGEVVHAVGGSPVVEPVFSLEWVKHNVAAPLEAALYDSEKEAQVYELIVAFNGKVQSFFSVRKNSKKTQRAFDVVCLYCEKMSARPVLRRSFGGVVGLRDLTQSGEGEDSEVEDLLGSFVQLGLSLDSGDEGRVGASAPVAEFADDDSEAQKEEAPCVFEKPRVPLGFGGVSSGFAFCMQSPEVRSRPTETFDSASKKPFRKGSKRRPPLSKEAVYIQGSMPGLDLGEPAVKGNLRRVGPVYGSLSKRKRSGHTDYSSR